MSVHAHRRARLRAAAAATAAATLLSIAVVSAPATAAPSAPSADAEWETLHARLLELSAEWTEPDFTGAITRTMPDTALLGNGDVGVTSGGGEGFKTFYVSKGDFWTGNPTPTPAGLGGVIIGTIPAPNNQGNLALGKPVTASSHHDTFVPERAVSGEWGPGYEGWVSAVGKPQWLQVDLGSPTEISSAVIKHDTAARPSETANTTSDFVVEVSEDASSWTTVASVTGNTEPTSALSFDQVTARYVRLTVTTPTQESTPDSTQNPRARIGQFELYDRVGDDLAVGAVATASGHHDSFSPDRAVNGAWGPGYEGWVSPVGQDQWFQVDLGDTTTFQRIEVAHDQAARSGEAANNPRDFVVEASTDGETWISLAEVTGNTAALTTVDVDPVDARYIRVTYTRPTQGDADPRARIGRLSVFDIVEDSEPEPEPATEFYERQNIADATVDTRATIDGHPVDMQTWAAANQALVVTRITAKGSEPAVVPVTTWAGAGNARSDYTESAGAGDGVLWATRSTASGANWTSRAALATRVIGAELTDLNADEDSATGTLTIAPGATAYVITGVGGGGENPSLDDARAQADAASAGLDDAAITALDAERRDWWREYWLKSWIDIGDDDLEGFYYTAQYHLGSSSRPGHAAPGIFGIWPTVDDVMWFGDYHLNYNFQAPFYGVYSSNRAELAEPAFDALLDFVPEAERRSVQDLRSVNASYIDSRPDLANGIEGGVLYPVGIGPFGKVTSEGYYNQVVNSLFNASQFVAYWNSTLDEEFLRDEAYPYFVKVATFFKQYLEWDASAQEYVLWSGPHEGSWGKNSGTDIGLLAYMLDALIEGSEVLGEDADRRADWIHMREHLPAAPVTDYNGTQVYALAEAGTMNDGRDIRPGDNTVNLEFIHPGERLSINSPLAERQLAIDTIDAMDSWSQNNSFPKVFTQAARAGYPADALIERLRHEITTLSAPNLRVTDPWHGIEKAGTTESINSMLMQSVGRVVTLFPSWPTDRDAAFNRLRADGAFVVTASQQGGVIAPVSVTSDAGQLLTVVNPWEAGPVDVRGADGHTVPFTVSEGLIRVPTTAGETYTISNSEPEPGLDPTITLSTDRVSVGGTITVTGSNFDADQMLAIELRSEPVGLGTVTADGDGAFTTRITVPAGTPAGAHNVVVLAGGVELARGSLTVTAAVPPANPPGSGTTGDLANTGGVVLTWLLALAGLLIAAGYAATRFRRTRA